MQEIDNSKLNSSPQKYKNSLFPQGYIRLFEKIDELLLSEDNIIIAIDGMCGGGKTYLSNLLEKRYDCNVFHADSFFLQGHQRTAERLSEIGGNLDFERLKTDVLDKIFKGEVFEYKHFSCSTLSLGETSVVYPKKLNIVEGSYIQNPRLDFHFDINVFICTSSETQEKRILKRNGEEKLKQFKELWIPKENAYFKAFDIKENCDIIIET